MIVLTARVERRAFIDIYWPEIEIMTILVFIVDLRINDAAVPYTRREALDRYRVWVARVAGLVASRLVETAARSLMSKF